MDEERTKDVGDKDIVGEAILREIRDRIVRLGAKKIVIFGSYAYGAPTADSDLDLLIIRETRLPIHKRSGEIRRALRDIRVPKDILVYTPEEVEQWANASSAFITTILRKGRVVYG